MSDRWVLSHLQQRSWVLQVPMKYNEMRDPKEYLMFLSATEGWKEWTSKHRKCQRYTIIDHVRVYKCRHHHIRISRKCLSHLWIPIIKWLLPNDSIFQIPTRWVGISTYRQSFDPLSRKVWDTTISFLQTSSQNLHWFANLKRTQK